MEDQIAKICLDKYSSLKKTGKPTEKEWTVLSGIVLQKNDLELKLISLCTGTKCLGGMELKKTNLSTRGSKLSDSHAEILTRRAFLRFIYHELDMALNCRDSDVFRKNGDQIELKDVSFYFYSSQTPCGDCSIIPKFESKRIKLEDADLGEVVDIHRTGAKCLETSTIQDQLQKGALYHEVGSLRTKPGRGDRTLSLSCSDKMAKWTVMGLQGALLSLMIPSPIYLKAIVIGGGCPFSLECMERGIYKRFHENVPHKPHIVQSKLKFPEMKGQTRIRPCPSSIIWCALPENNLETSVNGLRQGATKNLKSKTSNCLSTSRKAIFSKFLGVFETFLRGKRVLRFPKKIFYCHYKQLSKNYTKRKQQFSNLFLQWPTKPSYLQDVLPF